MKTRVSLKLATVLVIGAFGAASCATTGQSAGLGALLGGATGAIIGNQSGHAGTGALIGAGVGALLGYGVGKIHQKQVASRQQVEQQMQQRGEAVPTTPTVTLEPLQVAPESVQAGKTVLVNGKYRAIGPGDAPVTGKLCFKKDSTVLKEKDLNFTQTGDNEFSADITPASDAADGTYTVVVQLQRGTSKDERAATFDVKS